jgi:hypothetical protein
MQDIRALHRADPAPRPQMRRYEIRSLTPKGDIAETRQIAPALPLFEDAFCAFARGTLIDTEHGQMAIEDLLPGDQIRTADGSCQPVVWIGSTTLVPGQRKSRSRSFNLSRIMADSFGMARPMSYLIAGPTARLLNTPEHLRAISGGNQMLTPVRAFVDGVNVIETTPPTAVQLYHLCLPRHAVIKISGLEFETYHPGANPIRSTSHAMRELFLNMFPHISHLGDFGLLAHPRAGEGQMDDINAA